MSAWKHVHAAIGAGGAVVCAGECPLEIGGSGSGKLNMLVHVGTGGILLRSNALLSIFVGGDAEEDDTDEGEEDGDDEGGFDDCETVVTTSTGAVFHDGM